VVVAPNKHYSNIFFLLEVTECFLPCYLAERNEGRKEGRKVLGRRKMRGEGERERGGEGRGGKSE
jgi:hypothetical protein